MYLVVMMLVKASILVFYVGYHVFQILDNGANSR